MRQQWPPLCLYLCDQKPPSESDYRSLVLHGFYCLPWFPQAACKWLQEHVHSSLLPEWVTGSWCWAKSWNWPTLTIQAFPWKLQTFSRLHSSKNCYIRQILSVWLLPEWVDGFLTLSTLPSSQNPFLLDFKGLKNGDVSRLSISNI